MSIARQRAISIREQLLDEALFQEEVDPVKFSELWDFLDFVSRGDGSLISHPRTGQTVLSFLEDHPDHAAAAYSAAVKRWTEHRAKERERYLNK